MVALGLFLLVLSSLLTAAMVIQNTEASAASVFGQAVSGLSVGGLFAAGVVTGLAALLGIMLMLAGARRRGRRTGLKRQVRDAHGEKETLAEENARLHSELAAARSGSEPYPDDTTVGRHTDDDESARGRHGLFHR